MSRRGQHDASARLAAALTAAHSITLANGMIFLGLGLPLDKKDKPWSKANEQRELQRAYRRRRK